MNRKRDEVKVTPGAVVDVVTPRGVCSAIVQNVKSNGEEFTGFLVRNSDHQEVLSPHTWLADEVVYVYEDERAAIWSNQDGEGVLFYLVDGDDIRVSVIGQHGHGRRAATVRDALKSAVTYLHQNSLTDVAAVAEKAPDIAESALKDILKVN